MKKIMILLSICLLFSCKSKTTESKKNTKTEIENEEDYVDILGIFDRDELIYDPHAKWFKENYDNYQIDELTAKKIQPLIKDIEITIFMGTWCSDSRRDSPAFFKLMDFLNVKNKKLKLIAMSLEKNTPDSLEKGLEIYNIPTFIFKKDGKEINRIVEFPIETLEKDIFNILSGEDYKNAYADF